MKLRKIVTSTALGLSMGLALLGSGVASAHSGPYANASVHVNNSHNVKVSVTQHVKNYAGDYGYNGYNGCGCNYGCGCGYGGYGYGYYGYGFGWPFGGWWGW